MEKGILMAMCMWEWNSNIRFSKNNGDDNPTADIKISFGRRNSNSLFSQYHYSFLWECILTFVLCFFSRQGNTATVLVLMEQEARQLMPFIQKTAVFTLTVKSHGTWHETVNVRIIIWVLGSGQKSGSRDVVGGNSYPYYSSKITIHTQDSRGSALIPSVMLLFTHKYSGIILSQNHTARKTYLRWVLMNQDITWVYSIRLLGKYDSSFILRKL